jgi:hypothetical protein
VFARTTAEVLTGVRAKFNRYPFPFPFPFPFPKFLRNF